MSPARQRRRRRGEVDGPVSLQGGQALPAPGYELQFDADMILLRRDDATVAAFGVADTTPSGVTKAAWEDYTRGGNNSA
jgi:hypothetical protein